MTTPSFPVRYEPRAKIGDGPNAEVWSAYDTYLRIDVAVKFYADATKVVEAIEEASTLKALEGDRILRVSDVGVTDDIAYLATDLAPGGSLEDRIAANGGRGLRPDLVVTWMRHALTGLQVCHDHGFVHRDVKPANIFLVGEEWAALGDFGLIARMDSSGFVKHGGDPRVRAPEMLKAAPSDRRADVYSAAVTMYRLLSGAWPVEEPQWADLRSRVTSGRYTALADRAPHVPLALRSIVRKGMALRAEDRQASATEMNQDLARLRLSSVWEPIAPHSGHEACWKQIVRRPATPHAVCVAATSRRRSITVRRSTRAATRVRDLCYDAVLPSALPTALRAVFTELDHR